MVSDAGLRHSVGHVKPGSEAYGIRKGVRHRAACGSEAFRQLMPTRDEYATSAQFAGDLRVVQRIANEDRRISRRAE